MDTTLLKGLLLLERLAGAERPLGATELALQLGWTKSNAHRVLRTLVHAGYAKSCDGRYECTLKLWEFGELIVERLDLRTLALPHVRNLSQQVQETVHVSVLDGDEVLYIEKVDSAQPVRAYTRIGGRAPAHCVATGKVLLAFGPPRDFTRRLKAFTSRSITDPKLLRKELARVRANGFAANCGEWRDGVNGLAAPICGAGGRILAAIGISGPSARLPPKTLRQLSATVIDAAQAIGEALRPEAGQAY